MIEEVEDVGPGIEEMLEASEPPDEPVPFPEDDEALVESAEVPEEIEEVVVESAEPDTVPDQDTQPLAVVTEKIDRTLC